MPVANGCQKTPLLPPIEPDCCQLAGKRNKRIGCLKTLGFIEKRSGGLAGTRTLDQCLKRALLYQLSYQPDRPVPRTERRKVSEETAPRKQDFRDKTRQKELIGTCLPGTTAPPKQRLRLHRD